MKKTVLIFSGYNQRAIIAFLRTLKKNSLDYAIIANSKDDTIFLTEYAENVYAVREYKELILNDILSSIAKVNKSFETEKFLIIPSSEAMNRFLLENRDTLEEVSCEISLVEKDLYEKISDKYQFNKLCIENGITVPKEYENIEEAVIPFAAKPKKYYSSDGNSLSPVLVMDGDDYDNFLDKYEKKDFYYQQFIGGRSFYLLYYFYKNGYVVRFSQENLVQQPFGKSVLACVSSDLHEKDISLKYEKMFKSLNFFGLVMVEVKMDQNLEYMIEANPRLWGPSQLFVDSGINFFESFLYDNGIIQNEPVFEYPKEQVKYFWLGGLVQSIGEKDGCIAYHGYMPEMLIKEFPLWVGMDVYCKADTYKIFKKEVKL